MGKTVKRLFPTIFAMAALLSGCGDEGCTETTSSYTVATLTPLAQTSVVAPKSVSVYGIGQENDSVMVAAATDFKVIPVLLNPDTTYTQLMFEFPIAETDTIRDTLSFYYKNQLYFLTIDCGCTVQNYLDSIHHTSNLIQNIEITNPEVTNEKKPNITLFY